MDKEDVKIRYVPNQQLKEREKEREELFFTWKALLFKSVARKIIIVIVNEWT